MARNGERSDRGAGSTGASAVVVPNFPETLGECVDTLYKARQKRLQVEGEAQALKTTENALKEHIIEKFSKSEIEGARGKVATCSVNHTTVPHVLDWATFMDYVAREKAYDLVQKRVNETAYRGRLDEQVSVPGVEPFALLKLSVQKRAR